MGGIIAMTYAMEHSQWLRALMLNDIGPKVEHESPRITQMVGNRPDEFTTLDDAMTYRRDASPIAAERSNAHQREAGRELRAATATDWNAPSQRSPPAEAVLRDTAAPVRLRPIAVASSACRSEAEAEHDESQALMLVPHLRMRANNMTELADIPLVQMILKLVVAGSIGALIGFERRSHHKPIGIAGMIMVGVGSATYMLLAEDLAGVDSSSISRTLQGFLSGIGFLGGAVIFKSGFDVKGIKAAAAVWITGATGLAIATSHWALGGIVGLLTALILFVADSFPDQVRQAKQEPKTRAGA